MATPAPANVGPGQVAWVLACFTLLFLLQSLIRAWPQGPIAARLFPWFYAGFFLDELFTRLTFRIWPARLSSSPVPHRAGVRPTSIPGVLS
jgi:NAD(P)H-quinone oxidoreductase subunit 5